MIEFDKDRLIKLAKGYKHIIIPVFSNKEVQELIKENKFEELFNGNFCGSSIISCMLLLSNIDFLSYLNTLPAACFYSLPITEVHLPDNIKKIGFEAFANCTSLNKLSFSNSIKHIDSYSLSDTKIKTINFDGTKEDFNNNIIKKQYWNSNSKLEYINCLDGHLKINKDE